MRVLAGILKLSLSLVVRLEYWDGNVCETVSLCIRIMETTWAACCLWPRPSAATCSQCDHFSGLGWDFAVFSLSRMPQKIRIAFFTLQSLLSHMYCLFIFRITCQQSTLALREYILLHYYGPLWIKAIQLFLLVMPMLLVELYLID